MGDRVWQIPQDQFVAAWNRARASGCGSAARLRRASSSPARAHAAASAVATLR